MRMPSTAATAVGVFILGAAAAFVAVAGTGTRTKPGENAAAGWQGAATPIELIALEHDRDGDRFIVRGIIRNPATDAVYGLMADVSVFGRNGALLTSRQAPVAATRLAAGAETPFVVIVPGAADVDRYHLSFRTAAGVVPHVDRRSSGVPAGLA